MAYWRLISGNRPRHGGYFVHLAILALSIGIVGTNMFDQRVDVALMPGESAVIDNYRVEYVGSEQETRSDREAEWANLNIYRIDPDQYEADAAGYGTDAHVYAVVGEGYSGDRLIGTLAPWQAFYPAFNQVSVRSGIRSNPLEDLYIIPSNFNADGSVALRISINPLAMWLWISGPIFLLGTVVALWPAPALERGKARAASGRRVRVPAGAAEDPTDDKSSRPGTGPPSPDGAGPFQNGF